MEREAGRKEKGNMQQSGVCSRQAEKKERGAGRKEKGNRESTDRRVE